MKELKGKVAAVTGAASGLGRAMALAFADEGMDVALADVDLNNLLLTEKDIRSKGVRTLSVKADVSRANDVESFAQQTLEALGAAHVVCNNAGVSPLGAVWENTVDEWQWILGVNLWGVIHGVHTFLPILKRNRDGGHIVNTASMAGLVAGPRHGAYAAAKYGVVGLTEVLAAELAADNSRVGVSVLCPGTVHTNIGHSSRNRPADLPDAGFKDIDIELEDNPRHRWIYPVEAGAVVVRAIKRGDLYALTHPDWYPMVAERHEAIAAAFREQEEIRQQGQNGT